MSTERTKMSLLQVISTCIHKYQQISRANAQRGFVSLLPLIILAFAAVSTTTPLLVENILNGNPPENRIAGNNTQQVVEDREIIETKCGSGHLSHTKLEPYKSYKCVDKYNYKYTHLKCTPDFFGISACSPFPPYDVDIVACPNGSECEPKDILSCVSPYGGIQCVASDVQKVIPEKPLKSCKDLYGDNHQCMTNPQCTAQHGVAKFPGAAPGSPGEVTACSALGVNYICCSLEGDDFENPIPDAPESRDPGNTAPPFNVGYCANEDGTNVKTRPGETKCTENPGHYPKYDSWCKEFWSNQSLQYFYCAQPKEPDTGYPKNPDSPTEPSETGYCGKNDSEHTPVSGQTLCPGNNSSWKNNSSSDNYCTQIVERGSVWYTCDDQSSFGGKEPAAQSGPISGTVNVLGSFKATSVKVTVGGKDYPTSKDSGDIAYKYETTDSFTGDHTVTATATLSTGDILKKSDTFPAGKTNADITIRTDTRDIITEKCADSGVSTDESFSGFQYTACMESAPTTPQQAETGKFNESEAAKAKDKGNPYCGKKAFDVYKCNDGSVETISADPETCNRLPWCPQAGGPALQPDPCAGPEKSEACSCQAVSSPNSQSNCADDLLCSPGRNPQIPGYTCCPSGKSFCPATNSCMGSNEHCGAGQATVTPIPTQFQQALGCPNVNSDETENVCASVETGTPTDGIQSNQPGYDDTKTYRRRPSGDTQCVENYRGTNNANKKFCWQESGSVGQTNPGGAPGQQPVQGGAGYIGKACPANPNLTAEKYLASTCESSNPQVDDYYCTKDFKSGSNVWACCGFGTRFCSLNNQCVSSASQCVSPQTGGANPGGGGSQGCAGGPGSATNHCYNGQSDCCTGYVCSGGSAGTQSCKVRGPSDPQSKCPAAQGYECSDTYDQARNVTDPFAVDACRSVNKKYCLKPAAGSSGSGTNPVESVNVTINTALTVIPNGNTYRSAHLDVIYNGSTPPLLDRVYNPNPNTYTFRSSVPVTALKQTYIVEGWVFQDGKPDPIKSTSTLDLRNAQSGGTYPAEITISLTSQGQIQPAQSGCPQAVDSAGNALPDSKSVCQATTSCDLSITKRGSTANDAACQQAFPGDVSKKYCCIDKRYTGSTASIASFDENACSTSRDCVTAKLGNTCVFYGNAEKGICQTR